MADPILYGPGHNQGPMPILIGITGHDDPEDDLALNEAIQNVLATYQAQHPHTPLVVLSDLSTGSARIGAREALHSPGGQPPRRLLVPLPLSAETIEQSFAEDKDRTEFVELLQRAEHAFVLRRRTPNPTLEQQKALANAYLVRRCHAVIVLWDGQGYEIGKSNADASEVEEGSVGQVIRFLVEQDANLYEEVFLPELAPSKTAELIHIRTPRKEKVCLGTEYTYDALPALPDTPDRVDLFNKDAQNSGREIAHYRCQEDLIPGSELLHATHQADQLRATLFTLRTWYATADALAMHFQKQHAQLQTVALVGIGVASASLLTVAQLPHAWWSYAIYSALAGLSALACWWYRYLGYGKRGTYYRGLAEGLRIQLFWRLAGLDKAVPDADLRADRPEQQWILRGLRDLFTLALREQAATINPIHTESSSARGNEPIRRELVLKYWIRAQKDYFERRGIPRAEQRQAKLKKLWWLGAAVVALVFGVFLLRIWAWVGERPDLHPTQALNNAGFPDWAVVAINILVVVFGAGAFVMISMVKVFGRARSLNHQLREYKQMVGKYKKTHERLDRPDVPEPEWCKAIEFIGTEALVENQEWIKREVDDDPIQTAGP